jgi:hypothetical protein
MARVVKKTFLLAIMGLFAIFLGVATGVIPYPLRDEMRNGIGIDARGFVWGASVGFSDYVATYTFFADRPWVMNTVTRHNFVTRGSTNQLDCIGGSSIPWWIRMRDRVHGECWGKDNYSEWGRTQQLFFDSGTGRVTVHVYEE